MAETKYLGGGCSCLSRPNCGHYSEIGGFAMKASAISKSAAKKAAEAAKKAKKNKKKGR